MRLSSWGGQPVFLGSGWPHFSCPRPSRLCRKTGHSLQECPQIARAGHARQARQNSTGKWQKRLINFHFLSPGISYHSKLLKENAGACVPENQEQNIYATDTYQRPVRQGAQRQIRARRVQREQHGTLQAIIEACEEEKAPVMLQISKGARQYANPVYLKKLIEAAVSLSNIPIAVHLDHGDTFELCKECIDEGFTSVMIDASHEPFEKNAEITSKVVEYAHKHNCVGRIRTGPSGRRAVRRRRGRRRSFHQRPLHQSRRKPSNSSRKPAAIRWPSPSATPTAPTNSRANSIWTSNASSSSRRR